MLRGYPLFCQARRALLSQEAPSSPLSGSSHSAVRRRCWPCAAAWAQGAPHPAAGCSPPRPRSPGGRCRQPAGSWSPAERPRLTIASAASGSRSGGSKPACSAASFAFWRADSAWAAARSASCCRCRAAAAVVAASISLRAWQSFSNRSCRRWGSLGWPLPLLRLP
jgi:hypothetical protein